MGSWGGEWVFKRLRELSHPNPYTSVFLNKQTWGHWMGFHFFRILHFLKIILACSKWRAGWKEHEEGAQTDNWRLDQDHDKGYTLSGYISEAEMADSGDGLNMGDMGEGRTREVSKTSSLSKQVLCYDLQGRREPQPQFSILSAFYTSYSYRMLYKGVKWIRHVWEGEGHNLGNQRALYQWLHWLNSEIDSPKTRSVFLQRTQGIH